MPCDGNALRLVLRTQSRSCSVRRLASDCQLRFTFHVSQSPKPPCPGPPHNPAVRELIANKRRYSSAPNREDARRGFRGWHERGYLPHRDEPGFTQFVTFRLVDTFPESLRSEWEHLWRIDDDRKRRIELEAYLARGRGKCHLRRERCDGICAGIGVWPSLQLAGEEALRQIRPCSLRWQRSATGPADTVAVRGAASTPFIIPNQEIRWVSCPLPIGKTRPGQGARSLVSSARIAPTARVEEAIDAA